MNDITIAVRIKKELNNFNLDVDFTAGTGITVLFGQSGAGKTTTLDCIAGLSLPDHGFISCNGLTYFSKQDNSPYVSIPARKRRIGYVVQEGALFPHRTVLENTIYSQRSNPDKGYEIAMYYLKRMSISHLRDRYPREISGGQQRRTALARAFTSKPEVFLLDEPFVHLDTVVRSRLIADLISIVKEDSIPTILVSHDIEEVARCADRIVIIDNGKVIQTGTKEDVLFKPVSGGIARLFGDINILKGRVMKERDGLWEIDVLGITWRCPYIGHLDQNENVEIGIRCGCVKIIKKSMPIPRELSQNIHTAVITSIDNRPDRAHIDFLVSSKLEIKGTIPLDTVHRLKINEGDDVEISLSIDGIFVYRNFSAG